MSTKPSLLSALMFKLGYIHKKDVNGVLEGFGGAVNSFYGALEQVFDDMVKDADSYEGPSKEEVSVFAKEQVSKIRALLKKYVETINRTRA